MSIRAVILLLSIFTSFAIVYPVLKSSKKDIVTTFFLLFVMCLGLWLASSYLVDEIHASSLDPNFVMAVAANIFGGWAIVLATTQAVLLANNQNRGYVKKLLLSSAILVLLGSVLPSSILEVTRESANAVGIVYGAANYIWVVGVLISVGVLFWNIYVSTRKTSPERALMRVVSFGVFMAIAIGLTTNFIVPLATGDYSSAQFAPFVAVVLSLSFAYAIAEHRLFQLRSSVFRAVGYALSIATLVAIYSVVIYGIILPIIYPGTRFELSSFLLTTAGIASTIYLYDKIKIIFDAITDKLFFKNSYSLPHFLDEFNQALINSTDIGDLASSIMRVMANNLKTEFFVLVVKEGKFEITIDSRRKESLREADAKLPMSVTNYQFKAGSRVVLKELINKRELEGLYSQLDSSDFSVAIDLGEASKATTSLKRALESGNYKTMLLGPKRSGESYNAQDLDALEIISKELVIALQNAMRFEEIKLFNLELQHKVDLATIKLRQQNKKLVVADELKDDFLSIASHQMRTPISAISGYASILNSGDAGKLNADQQKFAKIIENSTKRLSYLINDFLTASRLRSGKFDIDKSEADLKSMLKSEVASLEDQFESKDVKLRVNIDSHIPKMQVDEQKLRQVMMNLMDNALHYTQKGGKVEVTLKQDGRAAMFEVKDNGIGVPKDAQSELFSKMFRAGNAKEVRPDGTGLGLYLAKKVVLGHNGHIIFESEEGEGSTFGFKIPIK